MGRKSKATALHITEVTRQSARSGKLGPILTSFHHAPLDSSSLSTASPSLSLTVQSWLEDKPKIDLSLSTDSMTYTTTQSQTDTTSHFITYLAIRDKETGKTRLVETNSVVLKPKVIAPITSNPTLTQETVETPNLAQKVEASKHLIKAFGQHKGTRFYEQQERMKIDSSQVEDRAASAAARVDMERMGEKVVTGRQQDQEDLLPPRDITASEAKDVYTVGSILTVKELNSLKEAAGQVLTEYDNHSKLKEAQKNKQLSGMGVTLLNKILESDQQDLSHAAVILYLEGVIKFSRLRTGELRKGVRSLQSFLPIIVRQNIVDRFSRQSGSDRVLGPELEDKAKCYVIVLGLLVNHLSMDVAHLTEALWVRPDHLKKLVSVVGARMIGDAQSQGQKIVLRLPLTTFKMEMMRKRNKK